MFPHNRTERMPVVEAAEMLGMNPQLLRLGLQQDRFPFGVAIQTSKRRWSYYVNRRKFFEYLNGQNENEKEAIS